MRGGGLRGLMRHLRRSRRTAPNQSKSPVSEFTSLVGEPEAEQVSLANARQTQPYEESHDRTVLPGQISSPTPGPDDPSRTYEVSDPNADRISKQDAELWSHEAGVLTRKVRWAQEALQTALDLLALLLEMYGKNRSDAQQAEIDTAVEAAARAKKELDHSEQEYNKLQASE